MTTVRKTIFGWLGIGLCLALMTGCGREPETVLKVLAGSELRDMTTVLHDLESETGIRLNLEYAGSLDGAERLAGGENVDLAWFSHGKYLSMLTGSRVAAQEKIMLSPVVLGVRESRARAWGWIDNPNLTWRDIAAKAASGELRYAMTDPTSSNTGFTALIGLASAFSGSGEALQPATIDTAALKSFFTGQALTAGSSGWLAERYVQEQDRLDGMINYESVLLGLNAGRQLREKLALIYPQEGIVTADYPLMLLNPAQRMAYQKVVDYLRTPDVQRRIMEQTRRRPAIATVRPDARFPDRLLVELPFPNSLQVIDQLLFAYLDEQRRPGHAVFVLDVSGSMKGEGIEQLKTALLNLAGADQSLSGRFARFRGRERITFLPFSSDVQPAQNFQVSDTAAEGKDMRAIREAVMELQIGGGTALFSALQRAYQIAGQAQATESNRYYSIVLMSDGESNEGLSEAEFLQWRQNLPEAAQRIRVFPVLFAAADDESMKRLAQATGGRVFDGRTESLSQVFKAIRGYQ
ncbi:MAG: VWA domain-containing protein [Gammaproteobacteria bacterium]|nr:VWA domain-containing protein [Gammaproteobacteria bacterium]MCP5198220.1 VWA domain-containing protein [Gammaproteobacteria bacterium]